MASNVVFNGRVEVVGHPVVQADLNLITLFDNLPLESKPVFQGSDELKTAQIRNWMDRSQDALNQIEDLDLSGKGLSAIPQEMRRLYNLKSLNISGNEIANLQNLPENLQTLSAIWNQLSNLDNVVWPNTLINLYLACNRITSLDHVRLPRLKCLGLNNNEIRSLDGALLPIELEKLSIQSNPLTSIGFVDRLSLTCLVVSGDNQFSIVDNARLEERAQLRRALLPQPQNNERVVEIVDLLDEDSMSTDGRFPSHSPAMGG